MTGQEDLGTGTVDALIRLAQALDPGPESVRHPRLLRSDLSPCGGLQVLEEEECLELLGSATIGRLAYTAPGGPGVLPVTFVLVRGRPVFRTSAGSPLGGLDGQRVAFEVDCVDHARREGWSVVVAGVAHANLAPEIVPDAPALPTVQPWPGGRRDIYVIVDPTEMTGRRVVSPAGPERPAARLWRQGRRSDRPSSPRKVG